MIPYGIFKQTLNILYALHVFSGFSYGCRGGQHNLMWIKIENKYIITNFT